MAPEYYGLLHVRPRDAARIPAARRGRPAASGAVHTWATRARDGTVRVVLINAGLAPAGARGPDCPGVDRERASLDRLTAPSASATSGVTLGGQSFGAADRDRAARRPTRELLGDARRRALRRCRCRRRAPRCSCCHRTEPTPIPGKMGTEMPNVLIFGDTVRYADDAPRVPADGPRPVPVRRGRRRTPRGRELARAIAARGAGWRLVVHAFEEFGYDELVAGGADATTRSLEDHVRACARARLSTRPPCRRLPARARRPAAGGRRRRSRVDRDMFEARRRVKSEAELAGHPPRAGGGRRRHGAARDLLRRAEPSGAGVLASTASRSRASGQGRRSARRLRSRAAPAADALIVSHGAQTRLGHDMGSRPDPPERADVIDLWPRDLDRRASPT